MLKRRNILFLLCVLITKFYSQNSALTIVFHHFVNNQKLVLDSLSYKNDLNQDFRVSKFKYYVSNFHLKNKIGKDFYNEAYFLIDQDELGSEKIILKNLPNESFTSLSFIIGVDSLHNCNGAQSGALDPVNGMFWAWNTGYIFLKFEGTSSLSKSPGNFFEYHIGGYKQPNNNIKKIVLPLNNSVEAPNSKIINVKVNVLELLKTPTSIDFEKLSSVTDQRNANIVSDNYSDMFELMTNEK